MKKIALIAMALILAIGMVFAGGGKEAATASKDSAVTITYWAFPNWPVEVDQALVSAFEAKNPGIKVKLETMTFNDGPAKIEAALVTKTGPDVTYDAPGRIITWGNMGALATLDDIVSPVAANIEKGLLNGSKGSDGKYYMYPVHTNIFPMAFNKEMLEELGLINMLPYNRGDRSWKLAEYEALLTALRDKLPKGSTPGVIFAKSSAGDQGTRAFLANLNGNAWLLNDKMTEYAFNSPAAVKNLTWMADAIKKGLFMNGSAMAASDSIEMFVAGKAAHAILYSVGNEKTQGLNKNYNGKTFTTIYMPFPNDAGKPVMEYLIGGPCVFNNGDAAKIAASKKFIQFMATDPEWGSRVVQESGGFPCNSMVKVPMDDPELKWNAQATAFYGPYYNTIKGFAEMRTYWFPMLQAVMNGGNVQNESTKFVTNANSTLK